MDDALDSNVNLVRDAWIRSYPMSVMLIHVHYLTLPDCWGGSNKNLIRVNPEVYTNNKWQYLARFPFLE